ncbi:hypothetical protein SeMB42_g05369 [Synchytrium endobioticum]|uniref:Uncharacterized protein n=1 Tax=Synchytrium endobioticum TaxID=286115 RepID=A0A507CS47_9FUNG|nr:hypothetical protein SeMB42_g05369 [Synchytrium endobioticum]TPX46919.1 hypothetical protein SeLEV6574_g02947 [Synchytrium endobioticum]
MATSAHTGTTMDDGSSASPSYHPFIIYSVKKIIIYSSTASAIGASLGALYGEVKGLSRLSYAFNMGANWMIVGLPFFSLRELVLVYSKEVKARQGCSPWHRLGRDEFIASTLSGSLVGTKLGHMWRGWKAVPAGIIVYGGLAGIAQLTITSVRRWKQDTAYMEWKKAVGLIIDSPVHTVDNATRARWWKNQENFYRKRDQDDVVVPPSNYYWDPVKDGLDWVSNKINQHVTLPEWASPMANALDIEYRKKLNMQIQALEAQVTVLRKRVDELKRDKETV